MRGRGSKNKSVKGRVGRCSKEQNNVNCWLKVNYVTCSCILPSKRWPERGTDLAAVRQPAERLMQKLAVDARRSQIPDDHLLSSTILVTLHPLNTV